MRCIVVAFSPLFVHRDLDDPMYIRALPLLLFLAALPMLASELPQTVQPDLEHAELQGEVRAATGDASAVNKLPAAHSLTGDTAADATAAADEAKDAAAQDAAQAAGDSDLAAAAEQVSAEQVEEEFEQAKDDEAKRSLLRRSWHAFKHLVEAKGLDTSDIQGLPARDRMKQILKRSRPHLREVVDKFKGLLAD